MHGRTRSYISYERYFIAWGKYRFERKVASYFTERLHDRILSVHSPGQHTIAVYVQALSTTFESARCELSHAVPLPRVKSGVDCHAGRGVGVLSREKEFASHRSGCIAMSVFVKPEARVAVATPHERLVRPVVHQTAHVAFARERHRSTTVDCITTFPCRSLRLPSRFLVFPVSFSSATTALEPFSTSKHFVQLV